MAETQETVNWGSAWGRIYLLFVLRKEAHIYAFNLANAAAMAWLAGAGCRACWP